MWEKEKAAYAAGKRIQSFWADNWSTLNSEPMWLKNSKYRVHPDDDKSSIYMVCPKGHISVIKWPKGSDYSKMEFSTYCEALKLAEGFAKENVGTTFYVVEVVSATCSKPGPLITCTELYDNR